VNLDLAKSLVATLPSNQAGLFNPYADRCGHDTPINTVESKLHRLALHLACSPSFILVGEAPGYQGARTTGVAFTSERLLLEGAIPRIPVPAGRLCDRTLPFSEPSATIVWKALYRLGIAETTVLWNALQMHPEGKSGVWSNRTPNDAELDIGRPAMLLLRQAFPQAQILAIGRKAEGLLSGMGIQTQGSLRHPANGGATQFSQGLEAAIRSSR